VVKASGKDINDLQGEMKKIVSKEIFKYKSRNTVMFDDDKSDCKEDVPSPEELQEEKENNEAGNKTSEAYLLKQK
jgi:hypothetical protein